MEINSLQKEIYKEINAKKSMNFHTALNNFSSHILEGGYPETFKISISFKEIINNMDSLISSSKITSGIYKIIFEDSSTKLKKS